MKLTKEQKRAYILEREKMKIKYVLCLACWSIYCDDLFTSKKPGAINIRVCPYCKSKYNKDNFQRLKKISFTLGKKS